MLKNIYKIIIIQVNSKIEISDETHIVLLTTPGPLDPDPTSTTGPLDPDPTSTKSRPRPHKKKEIENKEKKAVFFNFIERIQKIIEMEKWNYRKFNENL